MKNQNYTIVFYARKRGALGTFQRFSEEIEAPTAELAVIKLYENYDHIHQPEVTHVKELEK